MPKSADHKRLGSTYFSRRADLEEFLHIVSAVRYILEHPEAPRRIYSDSMVAISWYRNRKTAMMHNRPTLQKAEVFLKVFHSRIQDIEVIYRNGEVPGDVRKNSTVCET